MAAVVTEAVGEILAEKVLDYVLKNALPILDDVIRSSVNSTKITKDEPLIKCHLAKSMGKLKEDIKEMDEEMKIMIGVTEKQMDKLTDRSWDSIVSCMMQNPCVEPMDEVEDIHRYDEMIKEDTTWFQYGGPADESKILEVEQWIKKLISDQDVIADLGFDPKVYAAIVARTGAQIDNFAEIFVDNEHEEHAIDIGILRYPDRDHRYYRLCRVELKAWRGSHRILFVGKNSNGIKGDYHCRKFKPRVSFIEELKLSTRDRAMAYVDDLFSLY